MVLAGVLSLFLRAAAAPALRSPRILPSPSLLPMQAESTELLTQSLLLSASGATSGDTFTLTASTVATPSSAAGTYSIVPAATGANLANYNVVYVNGTLTVDKATLTVTPNNQSIVAGSVTPHSHRHDHRLCQWRFANCHHRATGLTTAATSSSPAGTYPITASSRDSRRRQLQLHLRDRHPHHHSSRAIPASDSPAWQWPAPNRSLELRFSSTLPVQPEMARPVPLF